MNNNNWLNLLPHATELVMPQIILEKSTCFHLYSGHLMF